LAKCAMPGQQVFYPMVRYDRDVQRIDRCRRGKDLPRQDLLRYRRNLRYHWQQRYSGEQRKPIPGEHGIAVSGFIYNVLGRDEIVVPAFAIPPPTRQNLARRSNNL